CAFCRAVWQPYPGSPCVRPSCAETGSWSEDSVKLRVWTGATARRFGAQHFARQLQSSRPRLSYAWNQMADWLVMPSRMVRCGLPLASRPGPRGEPAARCCMAADCPDCWLWQRETDKSPASIWSRVRSGGDIRARGERPSACDGLASGYSLPAGTSELSD